MARSVAELEKDFACAKATMLGCSSKLAHLRQYVADLQIREWALESHMESVMHALADRMLRGKDYFVSLAVHMLH